MLKPEFLINMVAVGEQTGELDSMLSRVPTFLDNEVTYALEGFLAMIQPIMIGVMGTVVCFVLLSVFLPLCQIIMNMGA